jgi:hypothetical protein
VGAGGCRAPTHSGRQPRHAVRLLRRPGTAEAVEGDRPGIPGESGSAKTLRKRGWGIRRAQLAGFRSQPPQAGDRRFRAELQRAGALPPPLRAAPRVGCRGAHDRERALSFGSARAFGEWITVAPGWRSGRLSGRA